MKKKEVTGASDSRTYSDMFCLYDKTVHYVVFLFLVKLVIVMMGGASDIYEKDTKKKKALWSTNSFNIHCRSVCILCDRNAASIHVCIRSDGNCHSICDRQLLTLKNILIDRLRI